MGFFSRLFKRKKQENVIELPTENVFASSGLFYYVYMDEAVFGPFTLDEIKEYPLLEDTLVTTNTLNGELYEAKYFECFAHMFTPCPGFRIAEDGTIIRE